jgi:hypothetical protein
MPGGAAKGAHLLVVNPVQSGNGLDGPDGHLFDVFIGEHEAPGKGFGPFVRLAYPVNDQYIQKMAVKSKNYAVSGHGGVEKRA